MCTIKIICIFIQSVWSFYLCLQFYNCVSAWIYYWYISTDVPPLVQNLHCIICFRVVLQLVVHVFSYMPKFKVWNIHDCMTGSALPGSHSEYMTEPCFCAPSWNVACDLNSLRKSFALISGPWTLTQIGSATPSLKSSLYHFICEWGAWVGSGGGRGGGDHEPLEIEFAYCW